MSTHIVHFTPDAPIAAKQGAQSRLNTRKEEVVTGVKPLPVSDKPFFSSTVQDAHGSDNVFLPQAVTEATVACQLPQPRGVNIQDTALPIPARMDILS